MNKTDKKVKKYLDRAAVMFNWRNFSDLKSVNYKCVKDFIEIAKMIQLEEK